MARYVVDRERDVWLESLGTNGPVGHLVFALCVRGTLLPFEVDERAVVGGVRMHQVTTFGYSFKARNSHGIESYPFSDDEDARAALQELAVEAMLVYLVADAHRLGYDSGEQQVRLRDREGEIRRLTDFGYGDGVPTEVETGNK